MSDAFEYELFRIQAIKAAGLEGNPHANILYEMAWKNAWQFGKEEVLEHLCDMAETELLNGDGNETI